MNVAAVSERAPNALTIIVHIVLLGAWFAMLGRFQEGNVYAAMGPFTLVVVLALALVHPAALVDLFRPKRADVIFGVVVGAGMVAVTYPVYSLAAGVMPGLEEQVRVLYQGADSAPLAQALPWTLAILFAEEVLWRGTLFEAMRDRVPIRVAFAVSVLTYALAQLGSGSWIVFAMALCCGVIWTAMRVRTGRLIAALIAHAIWTPVVILLQPVV